MLALLVVYSANILYSGLALLALLSNIAIFYFWIGQEYLGAIQLLIYSGAIMVLFLFMIMLLNSKEDTDPVKFNLKNTFSFLVCAAIFGLLARLALSFKGTLPPLSDYTESHRLEVGASQLFAQKLYIEGIYIFEILALFLTITIVAAVALTKKDIKVD